MLNAVLFDLDNTLVDRDRAFRDCVHHHFPNPAERAELCRLDGRGHGDRTALFNYWEQCTGTSMNQSVLGRMIAERLRPDHRLLEMLNTLAQILKLGIITNGSGDTQRQKIHAAGLETVIPPGHVWISAEVGKAKPDPAMFLAASQTLDEAPSNCLYVGDYEPHDVVGANAAGMRVRLVDAVLSAESLGTVLAQERCA